MFFWQGEIFLKSRAVSHCRFRVFHLGPLSWKRHRDRILPIILTIDHLLHYYHMTVVFENGAGIMEAMKSALLETIIPYCPPHGGGGKNKGNREVEREGLTVRQWQRIGGQVMTLHEGYTGRGADFSQEQNPIHGAMAGYQLYFSPRNMYRVYHMIRELPWNPLPGAELLRPWLKGEGAEATLPILDLGSGAGAFSLAWLAWLAERFPGGHDAPRVELTLVDQGHQLLALAEANLHAFARRALPGLKLEIQTRADGVAGFLANPSSPGRHGIVGAAMMLNEMTLLGPRRTSTRAQGLTEAFGRLVVEGGLVMLVEPGTRKGHMNLMTVRDNLTQWPILHPCPDNGPCPFWGGKVRNWCHATLALPRGFFFDNLFKSLRILDFNMRHVNTAGLAFQAVKAAQPNLPFQARIGNRIVSEAMRPKNRIKGGSPAAEEAQVLMACSGNGRIVDIPAIGQPYPARGRWVDGDGKEMNTHPKGVKSHTKGRNPRTGGKGR